MKNIYFVVILLISGYIVKAQDDVELTKKTVNTEEVAAHVWFLAADELRGRDTGSPEIDIAAAYIAAQYRKYGVKSIEGSYYQKVKLESKGPLTEGSFTFADQLFTQGKELLTMEAVDLTAEAAVVFVGYGLPDELTKKVVEGKIVVALAGSSPDESPRSYFGLSIKKRSAALANGAIALVELYSSNAFPWQRLVGYLNRSQIGLANEKVEEARLGHVWINDVDGSLAEEFKNNKKAKGAIKLSARQHSNIPARNVIGMIGGTDPVLKNEYILLSAHYDHVGVKHGTQGEDSIYNGARDNAIGVAAILGAAKSLANTPAKRSILLLSCTGEEKGLLGSKWYAEHPPVPLNQIVYNLNIDGGGYNDITKVTVIGLARTTAERQIKTSAQAFGLDPIADPVPEQNLFDRSDNVSFAAKGIPAPTYGPGMTSFDEEIRKYYHQVSDNVETLDFDYLAKYFLSYALLVRRVANMDEAPFWTPGDKYEDAGKKLYGIE
jgi:hypothetical protein